MRRAGGSNQDEVRRHNLSTVVRYVHRHGPTTRAELTTVTGLNRSTVADLVGDLAARGLVREGAAVPRGGPGRPSRLVEPASDRTAVLALEISVDSLAAAIVGVGGDVIERVRVDRDCATTAPEEIVRAVVGLAADVRRRLPRGTRIVGVGVSMVGVIRTSDGFVHVSPNLGWSDVPLGRMLRRALRTRVPVRMANDGDLGALAEHTRGAGTEVDNLLYLAGEAGVGGGVIVAGRPLEGAAGYSGEVGHVVVNPEGERCRCGARGCWETETSEIALLRRAGRPIDGGREAVARFLADAAAGDDVALAAVVHVARWLGIGIAGLVNVFNPQLVVLGGLFAELHPLATDVIEDAVQGHALAPAAAVVSVVPSALGVDSLLLGAAELAFTATIGDPTTVPIRRAVAAS